MSDLKNRRNKIDLHSNIIKHITKEYTQCMEDQGYEEGILFRLMKNTPKTNTELVVKSQTKAFCTQLQKLVEDIQNLSSDVENIDNQRKQFDYRLSYLENVSKNIVTQTEYREETLRFEEKIISKVAKENSIIQEDLGKCKDYVDNRSSEFQDKINASEMKTLCKIKDCEELLKQRISENYLENQLKARDEKINKTIDKNTERNILRLDHIYKDLIAKFKYIENQMNEDRKSNIEKEAIFTVKTDTDALNKQIQALKASFNESNIYYDDQMSDFKKNLIEFNKRVTENHKLVTSITKEHEDLANAAHIAANAQELLNQCTIKLDTTDKEIKHIFRMLENKTDSDEFFKQIQRKMDRQEVLNMIGSEEEKQRIKEYVKKETYHIDKTIRDIEKYWDAKLVKIRSDFNMHLLLKKLDEKASHSETVVMFEESNIRVKECEETLKKLEQDMQYIANSFVAIRKYVTDIKQIHSNCTKSIACLSCGTDANNRLNSQSNKTKGTNQNKFIGFIRKGKGILDDQNLTDLKIRPCSAKKQQKPNKSMKSSLQKIGQEYSRLSRAIGLMKLKENESTPHKPYQTYTVHENSFLNIGHNKSFQSFQDNREHHEDSIYSN